MKRPLSPPARVRLIHPTQDRITEIEDAAMQQANAINISFCRSLGVQESFLQECSQGVVLEGANLAPPFDIANYPGLKAHATEAAVELERLTSLGKILWYPCGSAPKDLDVAPANIIIKSGKHRIVHDWSRLGLNQFLVIPPVNYGTMDGLISKLRANQFMAGLDFQDCFFALAYPLVVFATQSLANLVFSCFWPLGLAPHQVSTTVMLAKPFGQPSLLYQVSTPTHLWMTFASRTSIPLSPVRTKTAISFTSGSASSNVFLSRLDPNPS